MDRKRLIHIGLGLLALLGLTLFPSAVSAGSPNLPPRPPFPREGGDSGNGGTSGIVLHISAGQAAPPDGPTWAALWTLVQWQDGLGNWNDVDGWQGPPSGAITDAYQKAWSIDARLFGKGPFRWVVKQSQSGAILVASAPFYLPHDESELVAVDVMLSGSTPATGAGPVARPAPVPPAIVLHLQSGATANLWTVMQWGDGFGTWYDIARWEGPFDFVSNGQGQKAWPVEPILLGRGIFRWLVFQARGGALVATSPVFNLPVSVGDVIQVDAVTGN